MKENEKVVKSSNKSRLYLSTAVAFILAIFLIFNFYNKKDKIDREKFNNLRIYQVMVESYRDSDGIGYTTGYGPSNHKGDINGITASLDYVKELGMNAIWFTPIFETTTVSEKLQATGYFPDNLMKLNPKFGTEDDLRRLVEEAHKRGIYVILDGVFGHTGKGKIDGVTQGKAQGEGITTKFPESLDYYKNVAKYWIENFDIDGWRIDQAYQMYQNNHNYLQEIREAVEEAALNNKKKGKEWGTLGYMVGEIWDGSGQRIMKEGYGTEENPGLYSYFDFVTRYTLVQIFATQENTGDPWAMKQPASKLNQYGLNFHEKYGKEAKPNMFLTNHDFPRFGNLLLRGDFDKYFERHKAALSFLAAYTGPITLYYGDEYGAKLDGYLKDGDLGFRDDHVSRDNGRWDNFTSEEEDLRNYVKKLMEIREKNTALSSGTRKNLVANSYIYVDLKETKENKVIYAFNSGDSDANITLKAEDVPGKKLVSLLDGESIEAKDGKFIIPIKSIEGKFYQVF